MEMYLIIIIQDNDSPLQYSCLENPMDGHRGVSRGAKNVPHRLRFTRTLLQSKDLSMWFLPSLVIMVPQAWPQFWGNNP